MVEQFLSKEEKFFVDYLDPGRLFRMIDRADYSYLYGIKRLQAEHGTDKVYFAQIAELMDQSRPAVSKAMNRLKSEGFIVWKVEDDSERTYVTLTDAAMELMMAQRSKLMQAFKELQEDVGEEELAAAIHVMQRIRAIGNHVYEKDDSNSSE